MYGLLIKKQNQLIFSIIYISENGFGILIFQKQGSTNISLRNVSAGNLKTTFRYVYVECKPIRATTKYCIGET
jgi:hypothetical protein